MPNKEPRFEFVRSRTRKDRDRDRDSDTQSTSANSTVTTLREVKTQKHRKSFSSNPASVADTSSQVTPGCNDDTLEGLPPLPETEESEDASVGTSPIMRTTSNTSNVSKRSSPPAVDTPSRLQPYLEESEDTASMILAPNRTAESSEWIGPRIDMDGVGDEPLDALTPTPHTRDDPIATGDHSRRKSEPKESRGVPIRATFDVDKDPSHTSFNESQQMVYSWSAGDARPERYVHPSHMFNPFLQDHQSDEAPSLTQVGLPQGWKVQTTGLESSSSTPPSPPRPETRPHTSLDSRPERRREYPPPARIDHARLPPPPQPSPSPPMPNMHHQGYLVPVAPAPPPIPMHHTHSTPLPQPTLQPVMDHPAHIMHRIGSALPDIAALMEIYQGTCYALHSSNSHIHDIENQKTAQSEKLHSKIDDLTKQVQAILRTKNAESEKLNRDIEQWKMKHKKLSDAYSKERRSREDISTQHTNLKSAYDHCKRAHREEVGNLTTSFAQEKERMVAISTGERQSFIDQLQESHVTHESLLARIQSQEKAHKEEQQAQEQRWQKRVQDTQIEHTRAREMWQAELQNTISRSEDEKETIKRTAEAQRRSLINQHQIEIDDLRETNAMLQEQETHSRTEIKRHQKQNEDNQRQLKELAEFHRSEVQKAAEVFGREKEEYLNITEAAIARQLAELHHEIDDLRAFKTAPTSRESSQSRDLLKAQDLIHELEKEKQNIVKAKHIAEERQATEVRQARELAERLREENAQLLRARGPSQTRKVNEAKETIAKLQKENETLKADRARLAKPKIEEPPSSRSTTPVPQGEKLERTRSHRASGIFGSSTGNKSRAGGGNEPHGRGDLGREDGHRSHHHRDRTS